MLYNAGNCHYRSVNGSKLLLHPQLNPETLVETEPELIQTLLAVVDPLLKDPETYSVNGSHTAENLCLKPWFREIWIVLVAAFGCVGLLGAFGNTYMIFVICRELSLKRFINLLLLSLCISDLIKCFAVLPTSVMLNLVRHWLFSAFLCHATPMLQAFTLILSALTYLLIALQRYMSIFHPSHRDQHPMVAVCVLLFMWTFTVCVVLPYNGYIRYVDLGIYLDVGLTGEGLCLVGYGQHIVEYNTGSFVALFVLPLCVIAYLFARVSRELSARAEQQAAAAKSPRASRYASQNQYLTVDNGRLPVSNSFIADLNHVDHAGTVAKANKYLALMALLFALCWTPLQLLGLFWYVVPESEQAAPTIDCLFMAFMFLGFCSVMINPILLMYQRKAFHDTARDSLQVMRRISSTLSRKRQRHSQDVSRSDTNELGTCL